jgi:UDP-glucose 4-epimerase
MRKAVVTGGSGFVGRHVARAFADAGYECAVFDVAEPPAALAGLGFASGTLLSLDDLQAAFRGADAVAHLAGVGDVYLAAEDPALAAALNVTGSANVAEACRREGVRKLVYASTWEVYGHPRYQPIDEDHPCAPDHPYNITKLAGEQLVLAFDALRDQPAVALRLGTAYGPGMRPNSVFSIFIRQALAGEPISIKGSGEQWRQFTHARDIAQAFVLAAECAERHLALNIVAREHISIRRLAELVAERLPTQVSFGEARAGDIVPAEVSPDRAESTLGWRAEIRFAEGLAELIDLQVAERAAART